VYKPDTAPHVPAITDRGDAELAVEDVVRQLGNTLPRHVTGNRPAKRRLDEAPQMIAKIVSRVCDFSALAGWGIEREKMTCSSATEIGSGAQIGIETLPRSSSSKNLPAIRWSLEILECRLDQAQGVFPS
jgi:hypothetical protein